MYVCQLTSSLSKPSYGNVKLRLKFVRLWFRDLICCILFFFFSVKKQSRKVTEKRDYIWSLLLFFWKRITETMGINLIDTFIKKFTFSLFEDLGKRKIVRRILFDFCRDIKLSLISPRLISTYAKCSWNKLSCTRN